MSPAHAIHKKSVDLLGDVIYSTGKKVANDREAAIAAELLLAEQTEASVKIQAISRRRSARKRVAQIRQDNAELEASIKIQDKA